MQSDILHDHTADADRIELADWGEGPGPTDLQLDVLKYGHSALGRELMRDSPTWGARNKAKTLLPVDTIDLIHDAVDIVVELGATLLDLAMKDDKFFG